MRNGSAKTFKGMGKDGMAHGLSNREQWALCCLFITNNTHTRSVWTPLARRCLRRRRRSQHELTHLIIAAAHCNRIGVTFHLD